MLHEIAASGAAMNGCSAVHLTIFGLNPVVKFGSDRSKDDVPPPRLRRRAARRVRRDRARRRHRHGQDHDPRRARRQGRLRGARPQDLDHEGARERGRAAPRPHRAEESGLDGLSPVPRRSRPRLRRHPAHPEDGSQRGRVVRGRLRRPARRGLAADRRGGQGLALPPARAQSRAHPARRPSRSASARPRCAGRSTTPSSGSCSTGRSAPTRRSATRSPRPTSQLTAAWKMALLAARRYDAGLECGEAANSAKFLAAEAGCFAADRAVQTLGGMGYATRVPRGALLPRGPPAADRAGQPGDDPQLHRPARAGSAARLLTGRAVVEGARRGARHAALSPLRGYRATGRGPRAARYSANPGTRSKTEWSEIATRWSVRGTRDGGTGRACWSATLSQTTTSPTAHSWR